jgi:hypothetical protein
MGRKAKSEVEKKKNKSDTYQAKLNAAIAAYRRDELDMATGWKKSICALAAEYDVKVATLGDRVKDGAIGIVEFNRTKQKLSEGAERELEAWCIELANRNLPVTNSILEQKANAILEAETPGTEPVGKNWVTHFLLWHGDWLRKHWSRPLDKVWVASATPEAVEAYFNHYISIVGMDGSKITPELQFAFDETGLQPSIFCSQKVVGTTDKKYSTVASGTNRQLVTFVPVISAAGKLIMGMMIYPGAQVRKTYFGEKGNPHRLL